MSHFISFVRIPALALRQHFRPLPPLGILEEDAIRMHVWPHDIDFNLHMNNARYRSVMDYARMRPGIVSPPMPDTIAQRNELTREKLNAPS